MNLPHQRELAQATAELAQGAPAVSLAGRGTVRKVHGAPKEPMPYRPPLGADDHGEPPQA